jgi:hypothetical protein
MTKPWDVGVPEKFFEAARQNWGDVMQRRFIFLLRRWPLFFILAISNVFISCSVPNLEENSSLSQATPRVPSGKNNASEKLNSDSDDELVMLSEVDQFASKYSLVGLRQSQIERDCMELRIWVGFGPTITRGVVIARCPELSTVRYFPPLGESLPKSTSLRPVELNHKSNPNEFWKDFTKTGILELPDDSLTQGEVEPFADSTTVIVEVKKIDGYRSYSYASPCFSDNREARLLVAALTQINQEFGISFYKCSS